MGNVVAETMFPGCMPTRGNIVSETKFVSREAKMFPYKFGNVLLAEIMFEKRQKTSIVNNVSVTMFPSLYRAF